MPRIRRIVVVGLILASMSGCGLATRKLTGEPMIAVGVVSRDFTESSHRVAIATYEAMKEELASANLFKDLEFFESPDLVKPDGTKPQEAELPPNYPAFWAGWKFEKQNYRALMTLGACHFLGMTRDGKRVEVSVLVQTKGTLVTVHVDKLGDHAISQALLDKVADRLAHPACQPGTLEEAAYFKAFFGGEETREALPLVRQKPLAKP